MKSTNILCYKIYPTYLILRPPKNALCTLRTMKIEQKKIYKNLQKKNFAKTAKYAGDLPHS